MIGLLAVEIPKEPVYDVSEMLKATAICVGMHDVAVWSSPAVAQGP